MTARVAAVALALAAAACTTLALQPVSTAESPDEAAPATAGWSPRRLPQPVVDGVAQLRLQSDVAGSLGDVESCLVVDGPPGRLVDIAGATALIPASTIKILTAIGALLVLPQDFRFVTEVRADGTVDGGSVDRLVLVGGGDPLLGTPEWITARAVDPDTAGTAVTPLVALVDALVDRGVRDISGGVVGVAPRWSIEPAYLQSWPTSYRTNAIGPVVSLTVDGGFRAGQPASAPPLLAAEELTRLLRERGVTVGEPTVGERVPDGPVLASVESVALPEVLAEMLAVSDNLAAEVIVREIAAAAGGSSTADGVAVIREQLSALGLPVDGLLQVDGSGLSRENRVPCALLIEALERTARADLAPVRAGLAVAGERGTLAERLGGTALAGALTAKTGTLPGVSGLAGFLEVGPPLRFALLANGDFGEAGALPLRERVVETIARYPDAPPADALVPVPATASP